ncbi:LANO_0F08724g1_1 [Lachancea nothofagi CBS 11611]|uniref:LANO_0F08724g1_1 n=1 Tax=Lachancea nothofagi CBS 11611 TaxID=1266666 RepID=A0A1G4K9K7_9SACH|nr:LANO_0F08724g1_1 [Lachancea nothofagi CBS 11611]
MSLLNGSLDGAGSLLAQKLQDSSLSARFPVLEEVSAILETKKQDTELSKDTAKEVLLGLSNSFMYIRDEKSMVLVVSVFEKLFDRAPELLGTLLTSIHGTVAKSPGSRAAVDYLNLLEWINALIKFCASRGGQFEAETVELLQLLCFTAHNIESATDSQEHVKSSKTKQNQHRRRIRYSVLQSITKTFVYGLKISSCFSVELVANSTLQQAASVKLPPAGMVIVMGALTKAASQLSSSQPIHLAALANQFVVPFCEYMGKDVLLTKEPPSPFCIEMFYTPFAEEFLSTELFKSYLQPNLEKCILRSSDLGFPLAGELYLSIDPHKVDLISIFVGSKLMSQFFASLKSNKESVRHAALHSVMDLLRSVPKSPSSAENLQKFIAEVFKNLKSNLNTDYKVMISRLLHATPSVSEGVSCDIICGLSPYLSKEANETALAPMLKAYFNHFSKLGTPSESILALIKSGLNDKKQQVRKLWISSLLEVVDEKSVTALYDFSKEIIEFIHDVLSSPFKYSPNNVLGCFVCVDRLSCMGGNELATEVLSLLIEINQTSHSVGYAWLVATTSSELDADERSLGIKLLSNAYQRNPTMVGLAIVKALEEETKGGFSSGRGGMTLRYSTPLFTTLGQKGSDQSAISKVLIELLVVSQYPKLKLKNSWAGLVLQAKLDPEALIAQYADDVIQKFKSLTTKQDTASSPLGDAAVKSVSYAAFINFSVMAPLIVNVIEGDLNAARLTAIDELQLSIYKGNEGELVVDVLENKKKSSDNKNTKDYETLKWEEDIRKKQAKKNVGAKKYSKEEKELVDAQLSKESSIRESTIAIVGEITRSCELIQHLSNDACLFDNGANTWFPVAVASLLNALQQDVISILLPRQGVETFLKLSEVISDRLKPVRNSLALATLRAYNVQGMPENLTEEPLLELISRVLFRIKFVSNKKKFESLTLTFLLPLITKVLEDGKAISLKNSNKPMVKSEFVEEDQEEEHLLLAIEIIGSHAESFADPAIPRQNILEVLLSLLSVASKARSAKECFLALCQNISLSPTEPDLNLILGSLMSANQFVRATILEAIDDEFDLSPYMTYSSEIFILMQDASESNRETAAFIWQLNKFEVTGELMTDLISFFAQKDSGLRLFVAKAYATALQVLTTQSEQLFGRYLEELTNFYSLKARSPEPIIDEYGLVIVSSEAQKDCWEERSTTAIAFKECTQVFPSESDYPVEFVKFLVNSGALGDREALVRQEMKEAGIEVIAHHGSRNVENLIPVFEEVLAINQDNSTKENVIILYGTLARYLSAEDARVITIVERLLDSLETPSEEVQQAVSICISPLVGLLGSKIESYLRNMMQKLLDPRAKFHSRRGAAWGLAGLVQGFGIRAFAQFDIIRDLIDASEDKREPLKRESVAFAFECLSKALGKFFEPYVIEVLPNILKNLGDSVPEVRNATANATKAIMANTTGFGVKKLIPVAVNNLEDIAWRTKRGSVELLGNMAYLDPTQLSASLSTIVPEIVAVLNDSHKEVRKAADQSLNRFGEVIRNPEIQKLVPTLIKAIGDPTKYTEEALDALIQTQFVHYIDGPSLALIIHVIHRGMRERSANTKRKACKIVGNMAILVDANDLVPYLQQLVDEVETAMVDPVPSTRATAARALGALVERLGEEQFPHLIPRLIATLSDDSKAGDRLGSAQALSEVISGIGQSKLDELLPSIMAGVTHYKSFVREGFMPLLLFLPVCFGAQFAPYISQIIQPILAGLADPDENISDTALKAGKLIVKNYATKAIDLLLPELELGMFDENERIRLSSVQLTSDLLFQVTGISSKNEFDDEETDVNHEVSKQMLEVLGQERRDRILSSLFVCRSDTSGVVRATTVDVWKAIVPNTPRTVKEILPTLTSIIVVHLASSSATLRHIAAQTLGDLVRRVGSNALSQLLPTLEASLIEARGSDSKQGVCIALRELIQSSSPESLVEYQDIIVNIIRSTLVDDDVVVRESAAMSFDAFQEVFGKTAVDEVLPHLLNMLNSSDGSEYALLALQEIMSTKSEVIFPILIPTLLSPPIDEFRARALGSLAQVAGSALYKRLSVIINALVNTMAGTVRDEQTRVALGAALEQVFCSVVDDEGMHPLMQQILSLMKDENKEKRVVILQRLANFFEETTLKFDIYTPEIVSQSISSFDDEDPRVLQSVFDELLVLIKKQDKPMLDKLVKPSRQALQQLGKDDKELGVFALTKGPSCILPVFLHGLMYGSNEDRETSAMAIADIVKRTPATNLKSFVTIITGPLIRVVGERFSSDVKAAILYALNTLFAKIPQFLRPFIPQLQRTFVKSLSDPSHEILRSRAARALGSLIEFQPRVDPLVVELVSGAKQATDDGVKTAMVKALLEIVSKAGSKLSESSKSTIVNLVEEQILTVDDKLATAYAKLIGSLSGIMTKDEAASILKDKVLEVDIGGEAGRFAILTLNSFLRDAPAHILQSEFTSDFVSYLIDAATSKLPYISDNALTAIGKLLLLVGESKSPFSGRESESSFSGRESESSFSLAEEDIGALVKVLCQNMLRPASNSLDSRRMSLVVVRTVARFKFQSCIRPFYDQLGPSIFSCLRDVIIPVKLAAEKAYLAVFRLVEERDMETFESWFSQLSGSVVEDSLGNSIPLRSIGDYTRRVGKRLAGVERDRIAAGGDPETVFSDRFEDESEIWAVGGVELVKDA